LKPKSSAVASPPAARAWATAVAVGTITFLPAAFLLPTAFFFAVAWLALVGLVVPVCLLEGRGALQGVRRAVELGRADYVHALASLATLTLVYWLTRNALVPLRDGAYLELVAFVDPEDGRDNVWGWRGLLPGEGLVDYCAASEDLRVEVERLRGLGFEVEEFGGDAVRVCAVPVLLGGRGMRPSHPVEAEERDLKVLRLRLNIGCQLGNLDATRVVPGVRIELQRDLNDAKVGGVKTVSI